VTVEITLHKSFDVHEVRHNTPQHRRIMQSIEAGIALPNNPNDLCFTDPSGNKWGWFVVGDRTLFKEANGRIIEYK
jgi:hypothetical protein